VFIRGFNGRVHFLPRMGARQKRKAGSGKAGTGAGFSANCANYRELNPNSGGFQFVEISGIRGKSPGKWKSGRREGGKAETKRGLRMAKAGGGFFHLLSAIFYPRLF
jgi:hypothetical protein